MAFQPAPTWASPIITDERTKITNFNPIWLKWFVDLTGILNTIGSGGTAIAHNGLTGLQGGAASKYYHLTDVEYNSYQGASWASPKPLGSTTPNTIKGTTIQATTAGGFKSSDASSGFTGTITTASLVGKTVTIKDGIITNIA
jgi:hypothetical protein